LVSAPNGCQWTAASNRPWLTIDSGSSGSGDGTVNYAVEANPGPARSGAITVAGEVVDVDQASGCAFTIDPTSQSFGAGGGTGNVAVSATDAACEWTATSNDNWITITSPAGGNGSGNGSVDYSVSANNGTSRSGAVTIAGHTFTVTQGANCTFSINPANKSFDATGGSDCVTLTATDSACSWTATSNASWIDITSGSSGSGNGSICYSVENNPGTTPRSGAIAIAGLTFTVNQNADTDGDGIPDVVEPAEGRNPLLKDNDIFGNARLFAMQQYRDFLGREGDAGGISFWASEIQSGNRTRVQVIDNFFSSAEFQNSTAPVTRLYFAYFLRIPDFGGLTFWTGQLKAGVPLQNISQAFAQSAEFIARYGSLNNNDFVALVYNNVLGRAPDPGGLAFWKGQLDSGAMTRGQVMLAFSESTEFRALIFNEVFITQIYVGMLRRSPDQGGFDFWVSQLDSGVPRLALIEGFFSSTEYHDRFLPHIP
jgi:hypothetical protein